MEKLGPSRVADDWPKDGVVINSLADFILEKVRSCRSLDRYKEVPIPTLVHRVEAASVTASVAGTLVASHGTLSDFTTLRRAGDLTLSTKAGVLYISGTVALDTLHATFKRYSLRASVFRKTGDLLAVRVAKNSFNVFLTIRLDSSKCDVKLEQISLVKFSDVSVDMTGFSMLNQLSCKVAEWVIQTFSGLVKDIVESYATRLVNGVFTDRELVGRLLGYGMMGMVRGGGEEDEEDMSVTIVVSPCHRNRVNII